MLKKKKEPKKSIEIFDIRDIEALTQLFFKLGVFLLTVESGIFIEVSIKEYDINPI